jgi:hypothetical protein
VCVALLGCATAAEHEDGTSTRRSTVAALGTTTPSLSSEKFLDDPVSSGAGLSIAVGAGVDGYLLLGLMASTASQTGYPDDLGSNLVDDLGRRQFAHAVELSHGHVADGKVAFNGKFYLVAWSSAPNYYDVTTYGDQQIFAARVSTTGQVLDDPPIQIGGTIGGNSLSNLSVAMAS